jgi:hypothetical protein
LANIAFGLRLVRHPFGPNRLAWQEGVASGKGSARCSPALRMVRIQQGSVEGWPRQPSVGLERTA